MKYLLVRLLILLIIPQLCLSEEGDSESKEEKEAEEDDIAQNYIYLPLGEEADPVIDYRAKDGDNPEEPNFIFGPNNGPRVVEFYAPWCPHCQHFRDHYIDFGEQLQKLALQQPEKVDVKIYAVSCSVYRPLCKTFGIDAYPGLRLFKAGATNATGEAKYWQLHPFDVLKDLGLQTAELNLELPSVSRKRKDKSKLGSGMDAINVRTKQNVFNDAWLSLDFALKNGVFMDAGPLKNTTQVRLKEWLNLLHAALPPSWQIQNLVKALLDNFSNIIQSESKLEAVLRSYPPPQKKWSPSCTHGDPVAGYTCGLWELFHLVTIGVVEYNLMIATDDGELVIHTEDAAVKIRNFVESFFGCEVCRVNFVGAFEQCSLDRCHRLSHASYKDTEWIQLPVWLWETHNAVNVRLLHEKGKRENWEPQQKDEISKQWPSRQSCPKCWDERGGWEDETIYKFLRLEYWTEDELSEKYRNELSLNDNSTDIAYATTHVGSGRLFYLLSLFFFGVGGSAAWYAKRQQRWLSGRHKKTDESSPRNGYNHFGSGV
jgi:thiol oxidase